jgi:hypothetical protein
MPHYLGLLVLLRLLPQRLGALGRDGKPRPGNLRSDQLPVMLEDHPRTVVRFQRHLRHVLDVLHSVGNERMPQRIVLPLHPGILRRVTLELEQMEIWCASQDLKWAFGFRVFSRTPTGPA